MSATFGDYCPIAVGAESFAERWTPLILRELFLGSRRFNEIHRGVAKMSRTLLSQRLRELERRSILERHEAGGLVEYRLTPAGQELEPIVFALGHWAAKWSFGDPADEDLDVAWLVWRLHQFIEPSRLPGQRTVLHFVLGGVGGGEGWLVLDHGESTACQIDPGYDVDLVVQGDNREMHRWFLGGLSFRDMQKAGHIRFIGPSKLARAFPSWFRDGLFADTIRQFGAKEVVPASVA
ncbi:MAG: winged helix-turn-helix transcriptional regulator [Dehalococcoidia bacterium]